MANVKPFEIIAGPLDVYVAATGTAFPGIGVPDASLKTGGTWSFLGFTEGGVKVGLPQSITEIRADQVTAPVKAVRSEESLEITFDLASITLENFARTLNQAIAGSGSGGVDTVAGERSLPLYRGGFQVETVAMLCRQGSLSPYGNKALQFEVPACFQAESPEATFTKEDKAVLACSWHAIADPDRATDDETFGRVRAGE